MNGWAVAVIGSLTMFFTSPMLMESASNPCHALEKASLNYIDDENAFWAQLGGRWLSDSISRGAIAESALRAQNPRVPAQLTCLTSYYKLVWGDGTNPFN